MAVNDLPVVVDEYNVLCFFVYLPAVQQVLVVCVADDEQSVLCHHFKGCFLVYDKVGAVFKVFSQSVDYGHCKGVVGV